MWLTKLPKMPNVSDSQQHQLLWSFFREEDATERPFCFRDDGAEIIMLSNTKPSTDSTEIKFKSGQTLMFECRASINPRRTEGKIINPKYLSADYIKEWFIRRLKDAAHIDYVTFKKKPPHKVKKSQNGHVMYFNQTLFFGTLTVLDADLFDERISRGFGKGCAFGFGALVLPQVMS